MASDARRLLTAALCATILVAACGATVATPSPTGTPTPAPTASPSPTPAPTASPSPTPAPTPSPTPLADPADGLAIASPYTLAVLDPTIASSLTRQIAAGSNGINVAVGVRTVYHGADAIAYVVVLAFPPGLLIAPVYQAALAKTAAGAKIKLVTSNVSGTAVSSGSSSTLGYAIFKAGDDILYVVGSPKNALPIAKAVIAANH
jgi:hypothetical protein